MKIDPSTIKKHADCQPRADIDEDLVNEYAAALESGENLPDIVVFYDGESHWLADGYHRLRAHKVVFGNQSASPDSSKSKVLALQPNENAGPSTLALQNRG